MSQVPYTSAVESLIFAMICTRPDIAQAMGIVSIVNPGRRHWKIVKKILRYIKGTLTIVLYFGGLDFTIKGYDGFRFCKRFW